MRILIVTNMYPQPDRPDFGTFVKDQVESLRAAGVEVDVLLIDGPKSTWNYLWGPFNLWRQLLKKRYQLIHAHYVLSGIIARLQLGTPVVVTYHGSEVGINPRHWLARLTRLAHPLFNRVIVVSPRMKATLGDSRVRVIPCGIDLDEFAPIPRAEARKQLGLPPDKPLALWIGSPHRREKRFHLLEQAWQLLQEDLPEAELLIVTGKPHSLIPLYLSAGDVLPLTSLYEGSPMVIKEAMACNLPIVSVDVGDVAAVIAETQHCYIVEASPRAIANKLRLILSNCPRSNGRRNLTHLSLEAIALQLIALYREVIQH